MNWLEPIRTNIHVGAHPAIGDWEGFRWHRYRGVPDTHVLHSSQAFCISVWGTIAQPEATAVRQVLASMVDDDLARRLRSGEELSSQQQPLRGGESPRWAWAPRGLTQRQFECTEHPR